MRGQPMSSAKKAWQDSPTRHQLSMASGSQLAQNSVNASAVSYGQKGNNTRIRLQNISQAK